MNQLERRPTLGQNKISKYFFIVGTVQLITNY